MENKGLLDALQKMGVVKELLEKGSEADILAAISTYFEPIHKEQTEKVLEAQIAEKVKKDYEKKAADDKIGTQNALKNKLAKEFGLNLTKDALAKMDYDELMEKVKESQASAETSADAKELAAKNNQLVKEIEELKAQVESIPTREQAARDALMREVQEEKLFEDAFSQFGNRFAIPKQVSSAKALVKSYLQKEGYRAEVAKQGDKTIEKVLKRQLGADGQPLKDAQGNDIWVPALKDKVNSYTLAEIIEQQLLENGYLQNQPTTQTPNTTAGQQQSQSNPAQRKPDPWD